MYTYIHIHISVYRERPSRPQSHPPGNFSWTGFGSPVPRPPPSPKTEKDLVGSANLANHSVRLRARHSERTWEGCAGQRVSRQCPEVQSLDVHLEQLLLRKNLLGALETLLSVASSGYNALHQQFCTCWHCCKRVALTMPSRNTPLHAVRLSLQPDNL